jgi:mRNA-degrading endonuclease RelE of RelBE toxin-antitoxin system
MHQQHPSFWSLGGGLVVRVGQAGVPDLAYRIKYSPATGEHLRLLTSRQRSIVFDGVEEQLSHEPAAETRNRKPMRPNPLAPWELRIGDLRVYYEIVEDAEAVVTIVAIGVKERDRILIGGKEIKL